MPLSDALGCSIMLSDKKSKENGDEIYLSCNYKKNR